TAADCAADEALLGITPEAVKVDRRPPAQIVSPILAICIVDISPAAPTRPEAVKKEPMSVCREVGRVIINGGVDRAAEVEWLLPGRIDTCPLGHPDVEPSATARSIRSEVETQSILRNRWMLIVCRRVNVGQINWRRPLGELLRRRHWRDQNETQE